MSERKWELTILFDATQNQAEDILERVYDEFNKHNDTGGASLARIRNLAAWERCRCGLGSPRGRETHNQESEHRA